MTDSLKDIASLLSANAITSAALFLIVAAVYSVLLKRTGILFLPGLLFSAVWSFSVWGQPLDFFYTGIWSGCLLMVFAANNRHLQQNSVIWYVLWLVPGVSLVFGFVALGSDKLSPIAYYGFLVCCIGSLLIIEQLVRNNGGLIKAIGIGIGALQLYNLYLYAAAVVIDSVSPEVYLARGFANTAVALMLVIAPFVIPHESSQRRSLGMSRPLALTTSSLALAGGLLVSVAGAGYLMRLGGATLSAIGEPLLLFIAILVIGLAMSSSTRRARLRVWVNKHFFQAKYDYNHEWRNVNERLSPVASSAMGFPETATRAVLPIFQATGGTLYLREGGYFNPIWSLDREVQAPRFASADHPAFFDLMSERQWVFLPARTDAGMGDHADQIPAELRALPDLLIVMPLLAGRDLIGFINVFASLEQVESMDWEDIDLVRMVGGQVANYVAYQMLSEEVVVNRQFDAFHQFTTFVVHDLKNLIAQQGLVVENATRFIDNPEFIKDAIKTIENSVNKMNWMLSKLSQKRQLDLENPTLAHVDLNTVLEDVIATCAHRVPAPEFRPRSRNAEIQADRDALSMAFTHLITNAQEACSASDRVTVTLEDSGQEVICQIIDTGAGMDQAFIDNRLFKPFDSTKKNQGMGVGAYQCRQILSRMGGQITVSSKPGEGSCFTIRLPKDTQG